MHQYTVPPPRFPFWPPMTSLQREMVTTRYENIRSLLLQFKTNHDLMQRIDLTQDNEYFIKNCSCYNFDEASGQEQLKTDLRNSNKYKDPDEVLFALRSNLETNIGILNKSGFDLDQTEWNDEMVKTLKQADPRDVLPWLMQLHIIHHSIEFFLSKKSDKSEWSVIVAQLSWLRLCLTGPQYVERNVKWK